MRYENGIPSNKNSNLLLYPGEYEVKAEHVAPAATKMGAGFTHVLPTVCLTAIFGKIGRKSLNHVKAF